jgi:oligopeptide/dipeptide ABC transporter ATP-binding protein
MTNPEQMPPVPTLELDGIDISLTAGGRRVPLVRGVSLRVHSGETLGLVGESGSGKTMTLRAAMGLLPRGVELSAGSVRVAGQDMTGADERRWGRVRGTSIAMIFQDAMTALNPVMPVGRQISEAVRRTGVSASQASRAAEDLLGQVGIPQPRRRARAYPHELSGGLRQRVDIAIALGGDPDIVLCDEPTTALDVTVQDQVLALLQRLIDERGLSLLYVSHDLAVVAQLCHTTAVMYAGEIIEIGPTVSIVNEPRHPYTAALIGAVPDPGRRRSRLQTIPGAIPDPLRREPGCAFAPRCHLARSACTETPTRLQRVGDKAHFSSCLFANDIDDFAMGSGATR